jgi:hypothetical protein
MLQGRRAEELPRVDLPDRGKLFDLMEGADVQALDTNILIH